MTEIPEIDALLLSLKLALVTTIVLLFLCTPLAWWLASTKSKFKVILEATFALPLVLPPTVLGFYLLVLLGNGGVLGDIWFSIHDETLAFSFVGLVIASIVYSFPFVIQPLQNSFESIGRQPLRVAETLGARKWDAFLTVIFPLARRGFLNASVLGFAHTLGEFGVVLMVGGNIPEKTRVISIAIYDNVEQLNYAQAHFLSLLLLALSFVLLLLLYSFNRQKSLYV